MSWLLQRVSASAADFHSTDLTASRSVYLVDAPGTTVVLGSRQGVDLLDSEACRRRGVDVAERRSGGGIVYLAHSEYVWIDVVIDRNDSLWVDDVRSSMHWVGNVWLNALTQVGMEGCRVHEGPMTGGALGELVCFAGVGPGEVVHASGAKLVGIAQRRTREHARFQCTALLRWVPHDLVELLAEPPSDVEALQHRVGIVDVEPAVLVAAFLRSLP